MRWKTFFWSQSRLVFTRENSWPFQPCSDMHYSNIRTMRISFTVLSISFPECIWIRSPSTGVTKPSASAIVSVFFYCVSKSVMLLFDGIDANRFSILDISNCAAHISPPKKDKKLQLKWKDNEIMTINIGKPSLLFSVTYVGIWGIFRSRFCQINLSSLSLCEQKRERRRIDRKTGVEFPFDHGSSLGS